MAKKNTKKTRRRTPTNAEILLQEEQEELFLQRRETIATACLQGILASGVFKEAVYQDLAVAAVDLATVLINELDADDEEENEEDEEDEEEEDESDAD